MPVILKINNNFSAIGIASLLFYYLVAFLLSGYFLSGIFQPQLTNVFFSIFSNGKFYFTILIVPIVALLPDLSIHFYRRIFYPTPVDIIMKHQTTAPKIIKQLSKKKSLRDSMNSNESISSSRLEMLGKKFLCKSVIDREGEIDLGKFEEAHHHNTSVCSQANGKKPTIAVTLQNNLGAENQEKILQKLQQSPQFSRDVLKNRIKSKIQNLHSYSTPERLSPRKQKLEDEYESSKESERSTYNENIYFKNLAGFTCAAGQHLDSLNLNVNAFENKDIAALPGMSEKPQETRDSKMKEKILRSRTNTKKSTPSKSRFRISETEVKREFSTGEINIPLKTILSPSLPPMKEEENLILPK